MVAGIYLITNKINGHMYVGGSVDIKKRLDNHKRGNDSDTQAIDKAILKYGKENFIYQIITELPADWKVIGEHEKYWINFYNTFEDKNHYNLTEGGEGVSGWRHSEDFKKEQSKRMSGENNPMHGMCGEKSPNYGVPRSKEVRDKISESQKGDKSVHWKGYARIHGIGLNKDGKQNYALYFNGKRLKRSIYKDKLIKYFIENYPLEIIQIPKYINNKLPKPSVDYATIQKAGFNKQKKQIYAIKFKGHKIKSSIDKNKLIQFFLKNYPLEIIKIPKGLI